jgi:hypothetical protein
MCSRLSRQTILYQDARLKRVLSSQFTNVAQTQRPRQFTA